MVFRFIRIVTLLTSFMFLTGFIPFLTLLAPTYTITTTGSFYKAGAQYFFNKKIKDRTGKNSLDFIKEKITIKDDANYLNQELKKLVKRRIELTRKKLNFKNINQ